MTSDDDSDGMRRMCSRTEGWKGWMERMDAWMLGIGIGIEVAQPVRASKRGTPCYAGIGKNQATRGSERRRSCRVQMRFQVPVLHIKYWVLNIEDGRSAEHGAPSTDDRGEWKLNSTYGTRRDGR